MTLRELFEALDRGILERMIRDQRAEDLHLDFKRTKTPDFSRSDDTRLLARSLSGFANSAGGVIVWGVDARTGPDGVDCAQSIVPYDALQLFVSRLKELGDMALSPPLLGWT